MKIVTDSISLEELRAMAAGSFGDMVKAVVDVSREVMAIDADLHADLETLLLQDGSRQTDLWGINLYPDSGVEGFIEYDSMINVRPSYGNRSRGVESSGTRREINRVVEMRVKR